jgi:hypothetical protein
MLGKVRADRKHSGSPQSGRRRINGKPQPTRNNSKRNDFARLHVTRHRTPLQSGSATDQKLAASPMSKQPLLVIVAPHRARQLARLERNRRRDGSVLRAHRTCQSTVLLVILSRKQGQRRCGRRTRSDRAVASFRSRQESGGSKAPPGPGPNQLAPRRVWGGVHSRAHCLSVDAPCVQGTETPEPEVRQLVALRRSPSPRHANGARPALVTVAVL